jgi:hypothetical protein
MPALIGFDRFLSQRVTSSSGEVLISKATQVGRAMGAVVGGVAEVQ